MEEMEIDFKKPQRHRTQMTQIGRIFTDNFNPWVSVSSVKSVFYRVSAFIRVHLRLIFKKGRREALAG